MYSDKRFWKDKFVLCLLLIKFLSCLQKKMVLNPHYQNFDLTQVVHAENPHLFREVCQIHVHVIAQNYLFSNSAILFKHFRAKPVFTGLLFSHAG